MKWNYSYTQNNVYNECPAKYYLSYMKKIKEPSNPALHLGNLVHKLLELQCWKYHMEASWPEELTKTWEELKSLKTPEYPIAIYKWATEFFKDKTVVFCEESFIINGIVFKIDLGYILDSDPDTLVLIDYKVTKTPKTIDSIFKEGQLLSYRYAANLDIEQGKFKNIKVGYINILNYPCDSNTVIPIEPIEVSLQTAENYVNEMRKNMIKIEHNEFPHIRRSCNNYGKECFYKQCGYCDGFRIKLEE